MLNYVDLISSRAINSCRSVSAVEHEFFWTFH